MINRENYIPSPDEDIVDASFENEDSIEKFRRTECSFHSRIKRLQSTLLGRLTLTNAFKQLMDKNYIPITLKNIDINIDDEHEIVEFLSKSIDYIESNLEPQVKDWMINNGSDFQKSRVYKYFK